MTRFALGAAGGLALGAMLFGTDKILGDRSLWGPWISDGIFGGIFAVYVGELWREMLG